MTDTKHTPGPWILNLKDAGPVVGFDCEDGGPLLPIAPIVSGMNESMIHANARLIAAAPDMLEVLEAINHIIEESTDPAQLAACVVARMADIRSTIRKATKP